MPVHDWTRLEPGDFYDFHLSWVVGICGVLNRGLLPPDYMAMCERTAGNPTSDIYANLADQIAIRHGRHKTVAIIVIISPGNKYSNNSIRSFAEKSVDKLTEGVNLLVVDLFPPTPHDPFGIHKAIWDEFGDKSFEAPAGKPLIIASYRAGEHVSAYIESIEIGEPLPSPPIFLSETRYITAPLEATYIEAWANFPLQLKRLMEPDNRNGHGGDNS